MDTNIKSVLGRHGRWVLLVFSFIAFAAVWYILPVENWMEAFNEWIGRRGPWGYVLFVVAYAMASVLFFPGSVLTLGAGLAFGLWRGLAVVSAGSTLGAGVAFLIARYLLREKVQTVAYRNPKFRKMDEAIGKDGWKMVALLRLSPLVPFSLSNYLYGVTRIHFWSYLAASWIGMLPGTFFYVYLGAAGNRGGDGPWKWALIAVGLVATFVVIRWISHAAERAVATKD